MTKTRFSDIVEIDTLELPKMLPDRHNDKLWQWMKFLAGKNREDFMELAQTSPAINKAVGVLMELNASQRRRMLSDARQKARWDAQARFEGEIEKGVKIGRAQVYKEMGVPIADIAAKTNLSVEEIERL